MYRAPDTTPRCASCGATDLTPETKFDPSEGNSNVIFDVRVVPKTFLGISTDGDRDSFAVNRARVCLVCGHVMLGLGAARLAKLRTRLSELKAIRED